MALTDPEIRNAKPRAKRYKLADGGGLYIEVYPQGGKYWRLKYRYSGKEKRLSIGVYPEVSIKAAREKRDAAKRVLVDGLDPQTETRVRKARNIAETLDSFEAVAKEWMAKNEARWSSSYYQKIRGAMETAVFPRIGSLPIAKCDAALVRTVTDPIESRGALETARKVRKWISEVFTYAIGTGRISTNPCDHVKLGRRTAKNHPHLKRSELGEFLRKLHDYPGIPETRIAVKLLLLTFVRTGELRPAKWEEFDLETHEWRIPAERMKTRAEHLVSLSRQAIELLKELRQYTSYSPFLFPRSGRNPYMSENCVNVAIKRIGFGGRVVGHGFRATASSILNESGQFNPDAIERQLSHVERNKIRAAYHRAEYLPERKRMMQWWADFLDATQKGAEVVPITKSHK